MIRRSTLALLLLLAGALIVSGTGFGLARADAPKDTQRPAEAAAPDLADSADPMEALVLGGPAADRILRKRSQALLADPAASLRAALAALEAGDRSHASWLLGEIMRRHAIVADYAARLLVRVLLEDDEPALAAALARRAVAQHPESRLVGPLQAELGEALADLHDEKGARAAWKAALGEIDGDDARAPLLLSIAASEERSGLDQNAAITYRLIWYAHPTTSEATLAQHRLELLESYLGESYLTADFWRRRGNRLFRRRDNEGALEAFEEALSLDLTASARRSAEFKRAETLFRMRLYDEAFTAFDALPQTGDIPIWRARSMARAGQVMESIDAFREIAHEHRALRARATYLSALLLDGRGFHDEAEGLFKRLAKGHGSSNMGKAATWRLGWSAFRDARDDEAISHFDRLIARSRADVIGQLRARYWRARSLERQGEALGGEELSNLARDYPLSYYGWRAAERVRRAGRASAPPRPNEALSPGPRKLPPSALERARILLAAGFDDAARQELASIRSRARGLADRIELSSLMIEAGDYHAAQKLVVLPYAALLASGPRRGHEALWWHAWPSPFRSQVNSATAEQGSVPRELVYAIMREESGYRPAVVSPVGARGLLQIMIPTGEQLARDRGLEAFDADDLFVPRTNILLGSHYLTQLSRQFRGQASSSIASYNAGPEAVSSWTRTDDTEDDEWVEAIPYDQTRSYVKRVLRSLHAYRVLY